MNLLSFSGLIAIPLISSPIVYLAGRLGSHDLTLHRRSYFVRVVALLAVLTAWVPFLLSVQTFISGRVQEIGVDTIWLRVDGISLLMAGTKSHTRQQLQEEFRKLNAQVNVGGGGGGGGRGGGGGGMSNVTASITAPAENFLAAVRLAVEILKEPAYPQDEFDRIKTQRVKALEGKDKNG